MRAVITCVHLNAVKQVKGGNTLLGCEVYDPSPGSVAVTMKPSRVFLDITNPSHRVHSAQCLCAECMATQGNREMKQI